MLGNKNARVVDPLKRRLKKEEDLENTPDIVKRR